MQEESTKRVTGFDKRPWEGGYDAAFANKTSDDVVEGLLFVFQNRVDEADEDLAPVHERLEFEKGRAASDRIQEGCWVMYLALSGLVAEKRCPLVERQEKAVPIPRIWLLQMSLKQCFDVGPMWKGFGKLKQPSRPGQRTSSTNELLDR